jgi:hypothetical protein
MEVSIRQLGAADHRVEWFPGAPTLKNRPRTLGRNKRRIMFFFRGYEAAVASSTLNCRPRHWPLAAAPTLPIRHGEINRSPHSGHGLQPDAAAVGFDDALANRQPRPVSRRVKSPRRSEMVLRPAEFRASQPQNGSYGARGEAEAGLPSLSLHSHSLFRWASRPSFAFPGGFVRTGGTI